MVGQGGQPLGQLVAPGLFDIVGSAGAALGVGRAFVGLVNDNQVPALLPNPFAYFRLLGVVQRGNDLVLRYLARNLPNPDANRKKRK